MDDELEFDVAGAVDSIGDGLFGESKTDPDDIQLDVQMPEGGGGQPAAEKPAAEGEQPAATEKPEATPYTAPRTWRPEASAKWATLDPVIQQEILKREDDIFKGLEGYKQDAGFGKSMRSVIDPYMPVLQQYGIDPTQQVSQLLHAHHTLALGTEQQKLDLFANLAKTYKVDLAQLGGDPSTAPWVDPSVQALQTKLQGLESRLSAEDTRRNEEVQAKLTAEVEAFSTDKANVYFDEVASDMVQLLETDKRLTLKQAYDRAVWQNPAVREKEMARLQADRDQKAREAAEAKAAEARRATSVNVKTRAKSGGAAAPTGSIDDTLSQTLQAIKARS